MAAFRATLEEVTEADLILHVRDIAHPDSAAQSADVKLVLRDLCSESKLETGLIEVLNKIDLLDPEERARLVTSNGRNGNGVPISAVTGEGLEALIAAIAKHLDESRQEAMISVPLSDGAALAWLYDHGKVLSREDDQEHAHLTVRLDPADLARFEQRYGRVLTPA